MFKEYIDKFLKIKQESSGWPSHCETEEDRLGYIEEYEKVEGIRLNKDSIGLNPGLRTVSKLALNSFWGRWGMNEDKVKRVFITDVRELNKIISDPTITIRDFLPYSDEVMELSYSRKENFLPQRDVTNLFLAAFTTAYARLKLYSVLDQLGTDVLYYDTDSVIYVSNEKNDPPLGDYLGQFTDELPPNDHIVEFVSAGPKNYGYRLNSDKTVVKVRGFTLNYKNGQTINLESMKTLVVENPLEVLEIVEERKICRCKKRKVIYNKNMSKKYKFVYNKRVVDECTFVTYPFGFRK